MRASRASKSAACRPSISTTRPSRRTERRLGVVRARHRDQTEADVLVGEPVEVDPLLVHEADAAYRLASASSSRIRVASRASATALARGSSQEGLEDGDARTRAVGVLLGRPATDADGADDQPVVPARDPAAEDDVPPAAVGVQPPQRRARLRSGRSSSAVAIRCATAVNALSTARVGPAISALSMRWKCTRCPPWSTTAADTSAPMAAARSTAACVIRAASLQGDHGRTVRRTSSPAARGRPRPYGRRRTDALRLWSRIGRYWSPFGRSDADRMIGKRGLGHRQDPGRGDELVLTVVPGPSGRSVGLAGRDAATGVLYVKPGRYGRPVPGAGAWASWFGAL